MRDAIKPDQRCFNDWKHQGFSQTLFQRRFLSGPMVEQLSGRAYSGSSNAYYDHGGVPLLFMGWCFYQQVLGSSYSRLPMRADKKVLLLLLG